MGLDIYKEWIFPRLLDWAMRHPVFAKHRIDLLSQAEGEVLEIGFGSGLNLPFYPPSILGLTAIDSSPGMVALAERVRPKGPFALDVRCLTGEDMPLPGDRFDTVVSTWTLCSIPDVGRALREIVRVLRPGGKFLFVEHGLSPEPEVQVWQKRLNPLQKRLGVGCHLDRDMEALIRGGGLAFARLDKFYLDRAPRPWGYMYKGVAVRPV